DVPTLMMQRIHDIDVKIEEGRFIAERIKGAKLIEFDGSDHLFWAGNTQEVLQEMIDFIQQLKPVVEKKRQLLTIVVARIIPNMAEAVEESLVSINSEQVNQNLIQKYRGMVHYLEGSTCIATFEGPGKAIHCSIDFLNAAKAINMNLKVGIHVGECLIIDGEMAEANAISKAIQIQNLAKRNQILVTQTVRNLLPDAGLKFSPIAVATSEALLPPLFEVEDRFSEPLGITMNLSSALEKNGFLLERVLQTIDSKLGDEDLNVESLCQATGLSERQLQRKLKAVTNKSPNQLIRSVRLHRSKELLIKKSGTISGIAFATGFSNASYFAKCFKKEFGVSPSDLLL
ncbi:MAG: helix-turn-helix domain-containing protein, partial [Bacteroidota bacterium]